MQQLSRQGSSNNLNNQSRAIAFIAIFLFALAGLVSGFSVGAFVRPSLPFSGKNTGSEASQPSTNQSQTATHTPRTQHPIPLGFPIIDQYQYIEHADGSTTYTFSVHAVDHSGQPVHSSGITCKIWLTQDNKVNRSITLDRLQAVDTLSSPFPGEAQGVLNFASSTPQTQFCNNGHGTWNYAIAPSTEHGLYYMVILMDWSGVHFNWSWLAIVIRD